MALSEEARARLAPQAAEIIGRYPKARSALLPLLHLVQSEEGYVSEDGIEFCASQLGLTEADVTGVVSFYTMYKRKPVGDYHVGVCTNSLCAVMGGDAIFADLQEHLGVGNDETTADGKVSLEHLECNAACDYAPVVMVNWEFFDNMTPRQGQGPGRRPALGRRGGADPRRAAAVHLEAGRTDPGRVPRRPGGRRAHRGRSVPGRPADRQATGLDARRRHQRRCGKAAVTTILTPELTAHWDEPDSFTLAAYKRDGGYQRAAQGPGHDARPGHPDAQGLGPARPRRGRLPDRA